MASRATDHGRNRGSVSACAMRSRSWRLVPQIMEELVEVSGGASASVIDRVW